VAVRINIIYTTSTGNTEHVIGVLRKTLESSGAEVTTKLAEETTPEDLLEGDLLILACGTWNLQGTEGFLHPRMHSLLFERAKDLDLGGKQVAIISLGDDRYYFTGRATEHLIQFVMNHNGKVLRSPLLIINEPEGQENKITEWSEGLLQQLTVNN